MITLDHAEGVEGSTVGSHLIAASLGGINSCILNLRLYDLIAPNYDLRGIFASFGSC